jgi:hypothetical protein
MSSSSSSLLAGEIDPPGRPCSTTSVELWLCWRRRRKVVSVGKTGYWLAGNLGTGSLGLPTTASTNLQWCTTVLVLVLVGASLLAPPRPEGRLARFCGPAQLGQVELARIGFCLYWLKLQVAAAARYFDPWGARPRCGKCIEQGYWTGRPQGSITRQPPNQDLPALPHSPGEWANGRPLHQS